MSVGTDMSAKDADTTMDNAAHGGCPATTCCASSDPWEDGKSNVEHLTDCDGCERCEWLIDGFYMACDQCGHWGMQESDGWTLCQAQVFCNQRCADQFFGCDSSKLSETEPIHSPHNRELCPPESVNNQPQSPC